MKFIKLLRKLASCSDHHQHKLSCIIVNKNKVVSVGYNQIKTHPKATTRYNMLHAEINALLAANCAEIRGCTAYIFRECRNGHLAMARPCEGCYKALYNAGIRKIIYTLYNTWKEETLV